MNPVSYYNYPRLLFFKDDSATVDAYAFKEKLFLFIEKQFEVIKYEVEYSSVSYNPPDKDNQFREGYTRNVYYHYFLKNGNQFVIHCFDEESDSSEFKKSWIYNFYSLDFNFIQGSNWDWVNECWKKISSLMLENSFYDATFSYTFDGGLYAHFQRLGEEEALTFIKQYTAKLLHNLFTTKKYSYIEIQHKPYLELSTVLSSHPDKQRVTSIQMNDNKLEEWPSSLFEFKQLERLDLYNNKITKADQRFLILRNLTYLNLNNNPIVKDPEELEELKNYLPAGCSVVFY